MINVPTEPWFHYIGDAAGWLSASLGARWVYLHRKADVATLARRTETSYFIALALGAVIGAWVFGTFNTMRTATPAPSHSVAGALAGAIAAVELWKWRHGVRGSTGSAFVIPLSLGIIFGRWGCLLAGLPDETYGVPTSLPWGVNLGDGISRHPVQIYESLVMALFLVFYWRSVSLRRRYVVDYGFYAFVLVYAAQRFVWEFLKPYPRVVGPLNIFHILMIGLALYAILWIARGRGQRQPAST